MRNLAIVVYLLGLVVLFSCTGTGSVAVTYDANGTDSGSVPLDESLYSEGDVVTVLGNSGELEKAGFTLTGWNTEDDGSGSAYAPGDVFVIGADDVTLYAQWVQSLVGSWNGFIPGRELLLRLVSDGTCVLLIDEAGTGETYVLSGTFEYDKESATLSITLSEGLKNGSDIALTSVPGYTSNPVEFGCSVEGDTMTLSDGLFAGFGFIGESVLIRIES
jgi:uncharacterized repeat protein (TIGR02543 family)